MKIANAESDVLFPVPYWVIDFDDVEDVNRAILQKIDRVDWDAEHRRRELQRLGNRHHREDVFITAELVPSANRSGQRHVSLGCNADLMSKALSHAVEISYTAQK